MNRCLETAKRFVVLLSMFSCSAKTGVGDEPIEVDSPPTPLHTDVDLVNVIEFDGTCPGEQVPYEDVAGGESIWNPENPDDPDYHRAYLFRTEEDVQAWVRQMAKSEVVVDFSPFGGRSFLGMWMKGSTSYDMTIVVDCIYKVSPNSVGLIIHSLEDLSEGYRTAWRLVAIDPMWTGLAESFWTSSECVCETGI